LLLENQPQLAPPTTEDALEVLDWATRRFADRIVLSTSLGPQSIVILDLLERLDRGVDTVLLDTGLLFNETYALRRDVQERFGVEVRRAAGPSLRVQEKLHGPRLWERDPDACCALRKVRPLRAVLGEYDAWISGIRRDQSPARSKAQNVEWDETHGLVKVNPLVGWSRDEVQAYIRSRDLPVNPLLSQGYGSVGCWPCTRPSHDERGGRWAGRDKTECGIHLPVPEEAK